MLEPVGGRRGICNGKSMVGKGGDRQQNPELVISGTLRGGNICLVCYIFGVFEVCLYSYPYVLFCVDLARNLMYTNRRFNVPYVANPFFNHLTTSPKENLPYV